MTSRQEGAAEPGEASREESSARFTAEEVRTLTLVKAFEEVDSEGNLLPHSMRTQATRAARESTPGVRMLVTRAEKLAALLRDKSPVVRAAEELTDGASWLAPALFGVAFVAGLSLNALGPARAINLLSLPLFGVWAWNLFVYALLLWDRLRGGGAQRAPASAGRRGALWSWLSSPERFWVRWSSGFEHEKLFASALRRFASGWASVAAPLHRARAERAFHLGSIWLAVGAVCGMYLRGLAFDYDVEWESTFLERDQVQAILSFVFAPANALAGFDLTIPEQAREPVADAASWIHLYALTTALIVVLPRLVLAFLAGRRRARLSAELPLDVESSGAWLRLLAEERGGGTHAEVWSYSYEPSRLATDGLQALLLDVFGNRARIETRGSLEYGFEWDEPEGPGFDSGADTCVLVFNLAQSPEQEVHGHFLEGARAAADEAEGRILVLCDETKYRRRMGEDADGERRLEERRRSWTRLVEGAELAVAFLALEEHPEADALERVRASVFRGGRVAVG